MQALCYNPPFQWTMDNGQWTMEKGQGTRDKGQWIRLISFSLWTNGEG
ncbi:MAG: hypothetical protein LBB49_00590 [Gracilibacteraceae bacterium]|nr:hypothetical protein [Gracilibacteraceae bacterium]